jgi:hypothetical protein
VQPRRPAAALHETLEFPEAVGNELTLRRGLGVLLDRLLARPERTGRPPRKVAVWARLVGGASWRRTVTLREPTADPVRLRAALGSKLLELPAPALKLRLEISELAEHTGEQLELVAAEGEVLKGQLREGLRQVKAAVGVGGVSTVVEVAPWSRIPEARALSFRDAELTHPALVEAHADGTPRPSTGRALARSGGWRVVDRWWTEEPVHRRYFDVVWSRERTPSSSRRRRGVMVHAACVTTGSRSSALATCT